MQSHEDSAGSHALDQLRKRAEELTVRGENLLTAGAPNERALAESTRGGFLIRQLPDDSLALRISIGEAREHFPGDTAYLVYRGDKATITALLRRALAALGDPPNAP